MNEGNLKVTIEDLFPNTCSNPTAGSWKQSCVGEQSLHALLCFTRYFAYTQLQPALVGVVCMIFRNTHEFLRNYLKACVSSYGDPPAETYPDKRGHRVSSALSSLKEMPLFTECQPDSLDNKSWRRVSIIPRMSLFE